MFAQHSPDELVALKTVPRGSVQSRPSFCWNSISGMKLWVIQKFLILFCC